MRVPQIPRVFSGMQPSGGLHIGNWLGALRQWVELSRDPNYDSIYCVVDAHAITIEYQPHALREHILDAAIAYLAAGIDPSRTTLFVQSDVPQHMELAWYLASCTQLGELSRMTQFKDKQEQHRHNVNAGLFTYPVLMAADVLLYKATVVPVGEDQVQHLELARDITRRFNQRFGDVFPEPMPKLSTAPRIMGLDGVAKMSKSKGNAIELTESSDELWTKLRRAYTDPQRARRTDPGRPEVCNIFAMHTALTGKDRLAQIASECTSAQIGCGDCKKELHERLVQELTPIQDRMTQLRGNLSQVREILGDGAARSRTMAEETLLEVRGCMGLGS